MENTGQFWSFNFDWQLNPRLAHRAAPGGGDSCLCRLIDGKAEPWLDVPHADEMTPWPLQFNRAGGAFTMMSSLGRNRAALIRVDAISGTETLLAQHDKPDIGVWRISDPATFEIDAIGANHVRQEWIALNPEIESDRQIAGMPRSATLERGPIVLNQNIKARHRRACPDDLDHEARSQVIVMAGTSPAVTGKKWFT